MREFELLPKIQDADLKDKVVLVRMDHNVVKKGKIKDAFRIDATFATLFYILAKGGKPILMTHIGRPKDKKTGKINISYEEDVKPVVEYLKQKLGLQIAIPQFKRIDDDGYYGIDSSINFMLRDLRQGKIDLIYLPNTRFFMGEEAKGEMRDAFGKQLAALADVFVNDAFGSWQPHASTVKPTEFIPSYAGLLMQKEITNLQKIFEPDKPFLAVVAGSKFDTKIGPLRSILKKVDHLLLGGVIYNAYLSVKYNIEIKGIDPADLDIAREFVALADETPGKVLEPQYIVESDTLDGRFEGQYRVHNIKELKEGSSLNYVLDIGAESYQDEKVKNVILKAETIFVNAVMGFTPHFCEGTEALYSLIDQNEKAHKLYGGGDTLQELKNLLPGMYIRCIDDPSYYFFSGGGTILTAIELGSPWELASIKALLKY
mgnify:FL=1